MRKQHQVELNGDKYTITQFGARQGMKKMPQDDLL
jgi:hypothetical protein